MAIDDKLKYEKQQYDSSWEAAKMLALSLGKIDKYEELLDEEILPSEQSRIIQQALGKALEKQIITIEDQKKKKYIEASKVLKPLKQKFNN